MKQSRLLLTLTKQAALHWQLCLQQREQLLSVQAKAPRELPEEAKVQTSLIYSLLVKFFQRYLKRPQSRCRGVPHCKSPCCIQLAAVIRSHAPKLSWQLVQRESGLLEQASQPSCHTPVLLVEVGAECSVPKLRLPEHCWLLRHGWEPNRGERQALTASTLQVDSLIPLHEILQLGVAQAESLLCLIAALASYPACT